MPLYALEWPDVAIFRHFVNILKGFGFFDDLFSIVKNLNLLQQIVYAFGQIFIVVNGKK